MVCLASQCGYIVDFEINKGITLFLKDVILRRFSEVPMEMRNGVYIIILYMFVEITKLCQTPSAF